MKTGRARELLKIKKWGNVSKGVEYGGTNREIEKPRWKG